MHMGIISKKYSEFLEKPILPLIEIKFFKVKTTLSNNPIDQMSVFYVIELF